MVHKELTMFWFIGSLKHFKVIHLNYKKENQLSNERKKMFQVKDLI